MIPWVPGRDLASTRSPLFVPSVPFLLSLTMRSCTPLASLHSRLSPALATPIVGTIGSQIAGSPCPHTGFESVFGTDFALHPSRPRPVSLRLVPLPFVARPPLDSFFPFVPSMRLRRLFVVVYLLAFCVASFSSFTLGFSPSGNDEIRTRDPLHATQVHYQLCYIPSLFSPPMFPRSLASPAAPASLAALASLL